MKNLLIILTLCFTEMSFGQQSDLHDIGNISQKSDSIEYRTKFRVETILSVDLLVFDFSQFSTELSNYNIDLLNKNGGIICLGLGFSINKLYSDINFGFSEDESKNKDSLKLHCRNNLYSITLGYRLVESKRISLIPNIAFKWYRYRLLNSDYQKKIPLNQYLINRDIDLRFNQTILFVGIDLDFKFHKFLPKMRHKFWTAGFYAGYALKLNKTPWIYSKGNRLTTNNQLINDDLNLGVRITFCY
jgi:hypothetical protein